VGITLCTQFGKAGMILAAYHVKRMRTENGGWGCQNNSMLSYCQAHRRRAISPSKAHIRKPRRALRHKGMAGTKIKDSEEGTPLSGLFPGLLPSAPVFRRETPSR